MRTYTNFKLFKKYFLLHYNKVYVSAVHKQRFPQMKREISDYKSRKNQREIGNIE